MKLLMIAFFFVTGLILIGCEGNVDESESISACESITDNSSCDDCCQNNGWDKGTYSSIDGECECLRFK